MTRSVRTNNIRIGSTFCQLQEISSSKSLLSALDDKHYILENGFEILLFSLYLVRDTVGSREILADPDWAENIASNLDWKTLVRIYGPIQFDNISNRTFARPNTPPRARDAHIEPLSEILNDSWTPQQPRFHQGKYKEFDSDDNCLVDISSDMTEHTTGVYENYGQEIFRSFRNPYSGN